jgi:hypothetical protein
VLAASVAACDDGRTPCATTDAGPYDGPYTSFVWRARAPCPLPRFEAMGAAVGGQLLVMGGFVSAELEVTTRADRYDPTTDAWTPLAALPEVQTHAGVARDGDGLLLVGGFRGWPATAVATSYRFDPSADSYTRLPDLPSARAALALTIVGGRAHAIGGLAADGNSDSDAHEVLDLGHLDAGWATAPPMPGPRNHLGGATVGDRIYVVGGRRRWDETSGNQAWLSIFDPATEAWTDGAPVPVGRSEIAAATFAAGARLVVVGGSVNPITPSRDVYVYDPATNVWTALPPLPIPLKGAVADLIDGTIYVTTGSPTGTAPGDATYAGCCF